MNEFRDAADVLKGIRLAELREERDRKRKCDWNDPADVAYYRKLKRRLAREGLLPSDRKCPSCKMIIMPSKGWVVSKDEKQAICRSCYDTRVLEANEAVTVNVSPILRYRLNVQDLEAAFNVWPGSLREFARRAGWSRTYQSKLFAGDVQTVDEEKIDVMDEVFKSGGVTINWQ